MFGQSLRSLVLSDTGKIFIVLLLMIPVSIGVKEATKSIDGFIGAAITMISTFIIGLMLLWFVGFDTDLRQRIGGLSLQLVHRIRRIA
jgi:hypothetical protein